mmetsp:Transcript_14450/g.42117  ORF Transcript_14450/g.42117 Transcript_14450/m.42117 type:complete len:511 (-) Transcript_14450:435-1967(-)
MSQQSRRLLVLLLVLLAMHACARAHAQPGVLASSDPWEPYRHRVSRVQASNVRLSALLGGMLKWEFSVREEQLLRGYVYEGAAARVRVALSRALHGQPTKIGIIGGSISWGHGASELGRNDWASLLKSWLADVLPNVSVVNACVPGQPSALMVMCLEQTLADDVDIVISEYLLNDGLGSNQIVDNDAVINYERLVRRVLALRKRPAMVLLQTFVHGQMKDQGKGGLPFHATAEDLYGALAQYYDVPWLSFRNTVWFSHLAGEPGFQWSDLLRDDRLHPNDAGHKVLADLVVWMLQKTAIGLAFRPVVNEDVLLAQDALLAPMYENNTVPTSPMCMQGEAIKPFVVALDRFGWLVEGKPVAYTRKKMGYAGFEPGASITISVSTERGNPDPNAVVAVQLAYLRSYEHMGVGRARCISGCMCPAVEFDGHQQVRESQVYLVGIHATQHANCTIQVVITNQTSSGEHKVKISGVVIDDYTNDTREWDFLKNTHHFGAGEFMGVTEPFIPEYRA